MEIRLEQSLASAIRFVQDYATAGTEYYFGKIPENYYVPSIYFQVPVLSGSKASLRSYKETITFYIWFMASETWDAQNAATEMMEAMMLNNCVFPIILEDGSVAKKGLRIEELSSKRIEDGIVQVSIEFPVYFHAAEPDVEKNRKIMIAFEKAKENRG